MQCYPPGGKAKRGGWVLSFATWGPGTLNPRVKESGGPGCVGGSILFLQHADVPRISYCEVELLLYTQNIWCEIFSMIPTRALLGSHFQDRYFKPLRHSSNNKKRNGCICQRNSFWQSRCKTDHRMPSAARKRSPLVYKGGLTFSRAHGSLEPTCLPEPLDPGKSPAVWWWWMIC